MDASDYESLTAAIQAVPDGGTVKLTKGDSIADKVTINKNVKIAANGATFTEQIAVTGGNVTVDNANMVCSAASMTAKDNKPCVKVTGKGDFTMTNCTIGGTSRTGVSLGTSGAITFSNNVIDAGDQKIYNAVEFSIGANAANIAKATVTGNTFNGVLKNNGVCLYNLADGAAVEISDNKFCDFSVDNNCVRLSNPKNATATFNLSNNSYEFTSETPSADGYTAFLLLQDYAKKGAPRQEFDKFTINISNLRRNGKKLTAKGEGIDKVYYVYCDQSGILADGENDPKVNFK